MSYKKDFPIFANSQKPYPLVYLDSAATSQKPRVVIDAVEEFYTTYNANIHRGIYGIAEKATAKVEEVRKKVALFINAKDPSEIVFTHGATEGINLLAHSLMGSLTPATGVLLSEMEHHSNLVPWQHYARSRNSFVSYLRINVHGELREGVFDASGNETPNNLSKHSVMSVAHASNVLGTVNNISTIATKYKTKNQNGVFIVDAAQSVPHMKVDVQKLEADCIVFSGHKMFSPTGVGILWGRKKILNMLQPLIYGSQMIREVSLKNTTFSEVPEIFEPGTLPLEAIVGLGAAIDYIEFIGLDTIYAHEQSLTRYALEELSKIGGVKLLGPEKPEERIGVIAFTLDGIHSHDVAQVLASKNICVRAGHHCAMPLHKKLGITASIRVSLQIYNTEDDINKLVMGIKECKKLFSIG